MLSSTTAENLACTDEVKVYEDEGEEEEQKKSSENLTEDKVRLVIESETQIPRIFDFFGKNCGASLFKMPFLTDPRLASYFLPGYPAAIAAAMAAVNAASASSSTQSSSVSNTIVPDSRTVFLGSSTCSSSMGGTWPTTSAGHPGSYSHPSFWPTPFGSGGSSSGSSSGYASSEGSVGNAGNGWFNSTISPSGFNLSHYCPYSSAPCIIPHSRVPLHPPGRSADSGNAASCSLDTSTNGNDPLSSHLPQPIPSYVTNAFGLMPFYGPFGCGAAAAAAAAAAVAAATYTHQPGAPSEATPQTKDETNPEVFVANGKPDWRDNKIPPTSRYKHMSAIHRPKDPDWADSHLGYRRPLRPRSIGWARSPPVAMPFIPSTATESTISPASESIDSGSAFTSLHLLKATAPHSTKATLFPVASTSSSTLKVHTPPPNFYAAAACAAAVAAAVASWSGSGSPQSHGPQSANPTKLQNCSPAHVLPSSSALFSRSRNSSGCTNTSVRSPNFTSGVPTSGSPKSSKLAAAAAVAAALSPVAALYQRRDSGRTSASNSSAVTSPYSPSMFAAAAAAHMQLLSAAAAAASFNSTLSASSSALPLRASTASSTLHAITSSTAPKLSSVPSHDQILGIDTCGIESRAFSSKSTYSSHNPRTKHSGNDSTDISLMHSPPTSATPVLHHSPPSMTPCAPWYRRTDSLTERSNICRGSSANGVPSKAYSPLTYRVSESPPMSESRIKERGATKKGTGSKNIHIKKPLNAFMLFMKEMRARVQEECTLKESAAINQVLGRKWHELSRDEQTKYYDMARREKEVHQQLYPNWSARDNYAYHARKRKRRRHLLHRHVLQSRQSSRQSRVGHSVRQVKRFVPELSLPLSIVSDTLCSFRRPEKASHFTHSSPSHFSAARDLSTSPASVRSIFCPETVKDHQVSLSASHFGHNANVLPPSTTLRFLNHIQSSPRLSSLKNSPLSTSSVGDLRPSAPGSDISDLTTVGDQPQPSPDMSICSSSAVYRKVTSNTHAPASPKNSLSSWPPGSLPNSPVFDKQLDAFPYSSASLFVSPSKHLSPFLDKLSTASSDQLAKPTERFATPTHSLTQRFLTSEPAGPPTDVHSKSSSILSLDMTATTGCAASTSTTYSSTSHTVCRTSSTASSFPLISRLTHSHLHTPSVYHHYSCFPPPLPPPCPPGSKISQFGPNVPPGFFPPSRHGLRPAPSSVLFGPRSSSIGDLLGPSRRLACYNGARHALHPPSSPSTAAAVAAAMATGELTGGSLKKCRARFGLEHQSMWCKPCRRKKKCIRFISDSEVDEFPLAVPHMSQPHSMEHPGFRTTHLNRQGFPGCMDPFSAALRAPQPPIPLRHPSPFSSPFSPSSFYRSFNPSLIAQAKVPYSSVDSPPKHFSHHPAATVANIFATPHELCHSNRSPFHILDKSDCSVGVHSLPESSRLFDMHKHRNVVNPDKHENVDARSGIFGASPLCDDSVNPSTVSNCPGVPRTAHQTSQTNSPHRASFAPLFSSVTVDFSDTTLADHRNSTPVSSNRSHLNPSALTTDCEAKSLSLEQSESNSWTEASTEESVVGADSHSLLFSSKMASNCFGSLSSTLESPASKRMCIVSSSLPSDLRQSRLTVTLSPEDSVHTLNSGSILSPVKSLSPSVALNLKLSESVRFGITDFVQTDIESSTLTLNGVGSLSDAPATPSSVSNAFDHMGS